jgi:FMN-dependent NADH-azoreductase
LRCPANGKKRQSQIAVITDTDQSWLRALTRICLLRMRAGFLALPVAREQRCVVGLAVPNPGGDNLYKWPLSRSPEQTSDRPALIISTDHSDPTSTLFPIAGVGQGRQSASGSDATLPRARIQTDQGVPNVTKLLFVQASPRKADSKSIQIATTYLAVLRANNPDLQVDTLDLWDADLPVFDGDKAAAKMQIFTDQEQNTIQKVAWDQFVELAERFISADRYLIATPMWNASIPYRLKHYIDLIHQPGLLWDINPETGLYGLLEHKHATLALTSGVYADGLPPAFGIDYQSTYLRDWLNQAGVTEIDELRFQPTLLTEDPAGGLDRANKRAIELANAHGRLQP